MYSVILGFGTAHGADEPKVVSINTEIVRFNSVYSTREAPSSIQEWVLLDRDEAKSEKCEKRKTVQRRKTAFYRRKKGNVSEVFLVALQRMITR